MYADKLDGRIEAAFFDRKASEWHSEQDLVLQLIGSIKPRIKPTWKRGFGFWNSHSGNTSCSKSRNLERKPATPEFLLSNCSWKDGELTACFPPILYMLADANVARNEWNGQDPFPSFHY